MTLHELVVAGGTALSLTCLAILASLWPARRARPPLCLKARLDEECTPACLRTCHLAEAHAR